ncbi:MAG: Slp family lipoprotein [Thermodesulfobacteriota bacterium]
MYSKTRKTALPFFLATLVMLAGCAPVISSEVRKDVDPDVRFEELLAGPEGHTGKTVLLGGTILKVETLADKTVMEVLQKPLKTNLRPVDQAEKSLGRFLLAFDGFRDPTLYTPGSDITAVGTVTGSETRQIGDHTYDYPVISPVEDHLWQTRRSWPDLHLGIGVGTTF